MPFPSPPSNPWDEWDELEEFLLAPLFPLNPWAWMDVYHGRTDWKSTAINTAVWAAIPAAVSFYNVLVHPGKYAMGRGMLHGAGVVLSHTPAAVAVPAAMSAPAIGSYFGYREIVQAQPEHEQPSMWWHWIAALTGTGPGVGGYTGHVE